VAPAPTYATNNMRSVRQIDDAFAEDVRSVKKAPLVSVIPDKNVPTARQNHAVLQTLL